MTTTLRPAVVPSGHMQHSVLLGQEWHRDPDFENTVVVPSPQQVIEEIDWDWMHDEPLPSDYVRSPPVVPPDVIDI